MSEVVGLARPLELGLGAKMIRPAVYMENRHVVSWLDIDPQFDANWVSWAQMRPYVFVPELKNLIEPLAPIDFPRLTSTAGDLVEAVRSTPDYNGVVKQERITNEQIKFATALSTAGGRLRPVRLDKALLILFAINTELNRKKHPLVRPRIFLSAFNIQGLSKIFNSLGKDAKEAVQKSLAQSTGQPEFVISEFLKGKKVTFDLAYSAFEFLKKDSPFKHELAENIEAAIETPSNKHTACALGEDYFGRRFDSLPGPFKRPGVDVD